MVIIDTNESKVVQLRDSRVKITKEVVSSTLRTAGKMRNMDIDELTRAADDCCDDVKYIKDRIAEARKMVLKKAH